MNVRPAQSWFEQKKFLDFPWSIYKGDPHWVPQIRVEQAGLCAFKTFGHKDPFYEHNEGQAFIALDGKKVVGRILAVLNKGHLERYHDSIGFFGFFDCVDDVSVAGELFAAAAAWLKERGCTTVRGPVNPSLNHTLGLLIDGFQAMPTFMMTYNPPYYEKLLEENGFRKSQDLYAYWGAVSMLPQINQRLQPICDMIKERTGAVIRNVDIKHFQQDVETFLSIYNRSLTNTWGYVPLSENEIREMSFFLKWLIVPELTTAVVLDGKTVGASFALPDFNPRIKQTGGRITPWGLWKMLRRKQDIKSIRVISTNVLPEYQMQGLGLLLMNGLVPKVTEAGILDAEFSWVLESNNFSRGSLEKGGAVRTKTYRVYDREEGVDVKG